jgi:hypothetical protein
MHDFVLGFVCFTAGALFAVAVGFLSLGRLPVGGPSEREPNITHPPRVEPRRPPLREPDPHPAWPECGCPSEAFHTKYYPSGGVR